MNSNLVLVLVQCRFRCLNWSYFVVVLTAYESSGRPPEKKCNDFNRLSGSPELILNLPKFKNRKTPEGTVLGHTGMNGPERANFISGCRANVRPEHAQLGEGGGLLVIVPTPKEGKSRNKKEHLQLVNGSRGLRWAMLRYKSTLLTQESTLTPPSKMRVLLVVALMEANQCT